jgi:hypothetical protein
MQKMREVGQVTLRNELAGQMLAAIVVGLSAHEKLVISDKRLAERSYELADAFIAAGDSMTDRIAELKGEK